MKKILYIFLILLSFFFSEDLNGAIPSNIPSNGVWRCNIMLFSESDLQRIVISYKGDCTVTLYKYSMRGGNTNISQKISSSTLSNVYNFAWKSLNEFTSTSRLDKYGNTQDVSDKTFFPGASVSLMVGSDNHNAVTIMAHEDLLDFNNSQFGKLLDYIQEEICPNIALRRGASGSGINNKLYDTATTKTNCLSKTSPPSHKATAWQKGQPKAPIKTDKR